MVASRQYVRHWMTEEPISIAWNASASEAHERMMRHEIRRLPVLDGDELVGIITLGDVRAAYPSEYAGPEVSEMSDTFGKVSVNRIMSRPVITVTPATTVREAARVMLEHKVAGLPVVDGEKLIGILTESDIFRMVVEEWHSEPAEVKS